MDNKLIVANWKMSPPSLEEARGILSFVDSYIASFRRDAGFNLVFCPPFVFTEEVGKVIKAINLSRLSSLGAQDIAVEDKAALTGEVSGPMLVKLGVKYVIVGHSERRWKLGELDTTVNGKLVAALRNGLSPIVCIGERVRDDNFKNFLEDQIRSTFKGLGGDDISKCFIAYEPVWAISSNPGARPDTPESALESIKIISDFLIENWELGSISLPRMLYGGSVNSDNVVDFLNEGINGVLIGSASVDKEEFIKILGIISRP